MIWEGAPIILRFLGAILNRKSEDLFRGEGRRS